MTDETETPRNPDAQNPWYVLMTVAGEQEGESIFDIDDDLHARNRRYWNGRAAQALDDAAKARLVEAGRTTEDDLAPLTAEEKTAIETALSERCPDAETPNPETRPHLHGMEVGTGFCANGFLFPRGADFRSATFSEDADFQRATFSGPATVQRATFSGPADFESATFSDRATFQRATFSGPADFRSATFSGPAAFESATFSGPADFESATFSGPAAFQSATFSGPAAFESATFSGPAVFRSATFSGPAAFESATFSEPAIFQSATFSKRADFDNARFAARTVFSDVRFQMVPPTFFGAELHQGTTWRRVAWPAPPGDPDDATSHREAYERLKLVMDDQRKFADEHFFLRKELECREVEEPGSLRTLASRVFRALSDYGWSVERPLYGFLGFALVGWLLMFATECYGWKPGLGMECQYLWRGFGFNLSNLFGPFGITRTVFPDALDDASTLVAVIGAFQMFAGPILLFLLALGLRNRFRIK